MILFKTKRLIIKPLEQKDKVFFVELLSDSKIRRLIPQEKWNSAVIIEKFKENLSKNFITIEKIITNKRNVWGIYEKENTELIGLCSLFTNDENDWELGYRFRFKYWKKGYGTETTKGLIDFSFNKLNINKITADVNIKNLNSAKILNRFMNPVFEFYNKRDDCISRRYEVLKEDW